MLNLMKSHFPALVVSLTLVGSYQPPYYPPYPPPPHSHSWAEGSPIPKPRVMVTPQYVRRGGVVQVGLVISASDNDTCTVYWPPCSFLSNTAINRLKVKWLDDAGRTFGRLDANGQFVPESDPARVTHYKPPEGFTGHVSIKVEVDDIPSAIDPATGQEVATWDDNPQ